MVAWLADSPGHWLCLALTLPQSHQAEQEKELSPYLSTCRLALGLARHMTQ